MLFSEVGRQLNQPQLASTLGLARIPGLDFLRALAVIFVLIDHTGYKLGGPLSVVNGGTGVQIFFVLSGFLITHMLLNEQVRFGSISFKDFYQRRAARLLPVFYLYVVVGVVYLSWRQLPVPWDAVVAGIFYVVNYLQAFNGAPAHFLSHCWSLAVEEQFYFLWPLLLALAFRLKWSLSRTILVLIAFISLYRAASHLMGWGTDEYLYRALETRADHLLVGCLLAVVLREAPVQQWFERCARTPLPAMVLFSLLMYSGTFHQDKTYKYVFAYAFEPLLIALLIPLVILIANRSGSLLAGFLNAKWIVLIGQASYGIYLFHQLVLYSARGVVERLTGSYNLGVLASFVVVIVLAHLSFKWFESPIRERLRPSARVA